MEARKKPSESNVPQGSSSKDSEKPLKILLQTRDKRGLPHKTNSESSCEQATNPPELRENSSENPMASSQANLRNPMGLNCSSSISISTIGSARLTESQSSGYTTESSYQTATAGSGTSYLSQPQYRSVTHNYLREIHVGVESGATDYQIQEIRNDLRSLLCNEVALIRETSGGRHGAIYVIAYSFM